MKFMRMMMLMMCCTWQTVWLLFSKMLLFMLSPFMMFHECMIMGFKIPKIIEPKTRKKRKKPKNKTRRCKGVFLRSRSKKKRKKSRIKEKKSHKRRDC